jgi:hypothetical protein
MAKTPPKTEIKLPLFHPLAGMFPLLEGKDFDDFVADIGKHELQNDIDTWQGMILEGRNRALACQQLGIEPRYHECRFQDEAGARAYVISQNMHRRHLTAGQKRDIIAALLKADPAKSNREHARTAKVSHHTVAAVRSEQETTGQIAQLKKTVGADGKARKQPAQKAHKQSMRPRASQSTPDVVPASESKPTPTIGSWWHQDPRAIAEQMAAHMTRDQIAHLFALAMDAVKAKQASAARSEQMTTHRNGSTITQAVSLEA